MLILGDKEVESNSVSVRDRKGNNESFSINDFIQKVKEEVVSRVNN